MKNDILLKNYVTLKHEMPHVLDFFTRYGVYFQPGDLSLAGQLENFPVDFFEDIGIGKAELIQSFEAYMQNRELLETKGNVQRIHSITIIGGKDKNGSPEDKTLTLKAGSITSIVGPTGSGKSRLLADIEWLAQGDTPTGRTILINNETPDLELRFSLDHKLVAQLSQNMNFVMDATVSEFISMHAESRMVGNIESVAQEIIRQANLLAGESFLPETPLTALSGGQSRALMIADTAFLSTSPVVLIDEIENAGIDRKKALQLLVKNEKIILIATHDPILALMAEQRLVIKNGGISKLIITSVKEKTNLKELELLDARVMSLRHKLRLGEDIENI
jgi:ABC-type lipoprotein export system ATPase subunit